MDKREKVNSKTPERIDYRRKEERLGDSSNLEKRTSESSQLKGTIRDDKSLDIGERKKINNYLGKRVHEKDRFDDSIIKKKTKLKHSQVKTSGQKNEIAEDKKDIVGGDRNLLDNLNDKSINKNKRKTNKYETPDKETKSNGSFKEDAENPNISGKDDEEIKADGYEETSYELEDLNKNSKVSEKDYYKRKAIYASQKKTNKGKDGKLTTDDVKGLKDGMDNRTDEKSLKENITLSEKSEKKYRKTESRLIQKGKKAMNKLNGFKASNIE